MILRKTPDELEKMAQAGRILARCHAMLRSKARPGVTTEELDAAADSVAVPHPVHHVMHLSAVTISVII